MSTRKPAGVSNMCRASTSPEFMNRSLAASTLNRALLSGLAAVVALPFLVMNAKFTGSTPAVLWQAALFCAPVFEFCDRLSMFSAAHHRVGSQLTPAGHGTQPGG